MKKSSISFYVIAGLLLVIMVSFFFYMDSGVKKEYSSELFSEFQKHFDGCALYAILQSNIIDGFSDGPEKYQASIAKNIDLCMGPYLDSIADKGASVIKKETSVKAEINENTLLVDIYFPCDITYMDEAFNFKNYIKTFERIERIDLKNSNGKTFFSSDGNLNIEIEGNAKLMNMYGTDEADFMIIRLEDKDEKNGEYLEGNLIYGLLPLQYLSDSMIKICFIVDKIFPDQGIPASKLRIVFWNPNSGKWGVLPTEYKDGCLQTEVTYTTYYGIIEEYVPYSAGEINFGPWDSLPQSDIDAPTVDFQMYLSGEAKEIYEQVRSDMNGPWPLIDNPQCVSNVLYSGAFCAAASSNCGNGIHCKSNVNSMDKNKLNLLFRHEITHSIQIMNDLSGTECYYETPRREWGAEFYSDTQCYEFIMGGERFTGKQLAEKIKENPSCTDEMLMDAAFCNPGSYSLLEQEGCLLGNSGTEIADSYHGIDCRNV